MKTRTKQYKKFYKDAGAPRGNRESIGGGPSLEMLGVLLTKVDRRTNLADEVAQQVRSYFGQKVFDTEIRVNVSLAEAPGADVFIFQYAPNSRGAEDYQSLAEEVIARAE